MRSILFCLLLCTIGHSVVTCMSITYDGSASVISTSANQIPCPVATEENHIVYFIRYKRNAFDCNRCPKDHLKIRGLCLSTKPHQTSEIGFSQRA